MRLARKVRRWKQSAPNRSQLAIPYKLALSNPRKELVRTR